MAARSVSWLARLLCSILVMFTTSAAAAVVGETGASGLEIAGGPTVPLTSAPTTPPTAAVASAPAVRTSQASWRRGMVSVTLAPRGDMDITEGESRELRCRILNRPVTAQIRWFYARRNSHGIGYSNYTVLANEYLTINPEKLQSSYVEPATYILTVKHFSTADSGEYTCFLQASPYEVYRDTVSINVVAKAAAMPPGNSPVTVTLKATLYTDNGSRNGNTTPRPGQHGHDKARGDTDDSSTSRITTTTQRNIRMRPAVTVPRAASPGAVTTPFASTKPMTSTSLSSTKESGGEPAKDTVAALKAGVTRSSSSSSGGAPVNPAGVGHSAGGSVPSPTARQPTRPAAPAGATSKCDYHIIVHEVDESSCPTLVGAHYGGSSASAAGKYRAGMQGDFMEEARPFQTPPVAASTGLSERLDRLEDRLIGEMVKHQAVNHTIATYESMLRETEKIIAEQARNMSRLDETLRRMEALIERQRVTARSMDEKVAGLMLDMAEANARLDRTMKRVSTAKTAEEKQIAVASATDPDNKDVVHFKDCAEVYSSGRTTSDVYYIKPLHSARTIPVWCDMDTWPGGWLVIQRRKDGTQPFNYNWQEYRHGFGNVSGEFWLGNDNLFLLTNQAEYMLRVDMWDFFDSRVYAEYRTFKVEGERDQYKLVIGNHSGTAKDGLQKHDGVKFSTPDRDNDLWQDYHCALDWNAGWWFTNCWHALLNGAHSGDALPRYKGLCWIDWKDEQLKATEMKVRPVFRLAPAATQTAAPPPSAPTT